MNKVTAIIIDDEKLGRERIKDLLLKAKDINIIGECESASAAVGQIETKSPDLVFLDIQLNDATGFDVLQNIHVLKTPLVIFVTAYDEFALKAFDYSAFDYLLKPFTDERFYESLHKAIDQINLKGRSGYDKKVDKILNYLRTTNDIDKEYHAKLPIRTGNKTAFIDIADIKYILASGYYAEIYTSHKMHILRSSLTDLLNTLKSPKFIRIHRSTIVNVGEISEIIHSDYGEIDVKMSDNKLFRLSKSYKKSFMEFVGI